MAKKQLMIDELQAHALHSALGFISSAECIIPENEKALLGDLQQKIEAFIGSQSQQSKLLAGVYKSFMDAYYSWHQDTIGVRPKIDARQGKALNNIIAYLKEESKTENYEGALLAWQFVLQNWKSLNDFLQGQSSLVSIERNITEILGKLKNGSSTKQRSTKQAADYKATLLDRLNQKSRAGSNT